MVNHSLESQNFCTVKINIQYVIRSLYSIQYDFETTVLMLDSSHIVPDFDSSTDGQCFPKRKYFYWIINGTDFRDHISPSEESGRLFYFQFLAEAH